MGMFPVLCPSGQSWQERAWRSWTAFHQVVCSAFAGPLCQSSGWCHQVVAIDGPDPHGHTQPAGSAESMRSSVLLCLAPWLCKGEEAHLCSLEELNKQQQTLQSSSIGAVLFSLVWVVTLQGIACAANLDTEVLVWAGTGWFPCLFPGVAILSFHIPWAGVQPLTMTLGWDWDLIQFPPGCFWLSPCFCHRAEHL